MANPILWQSAHAMTRKAMSRIKGFSDVKVEKIKDAINKCLVRAIG